MKISKRMYWTLSALPRVALAGTALASVLVVTGANAQMPMKATTATSATTPTSDATPTNAQLQEENAALRKQIAQLQREQKESAGDANPANGGISTDKQGNKKCKEGMKMGTASDGQKGCMAMADGKSMKKDGMGMTEKHDSKGMPASSDKPMAPDAPMKDE